MSVLKIDSDISRIIEINHSTTLNVRNTLAGSGDCVQTAVNKTITSIHAEMIEEPAYFSV